MIVASDPKQCRKRNIPKSATDVAQNEIAAWQGLGPFSNLDAGSVCGTITAAMNVSVEIDDETYRRAESSAARQNMAVPDLVRGFLENLAANRGEPVSDAEFTRLKTLEAEITRQLGNFNGGNRLSPDEVHDRKLR